MMSFFRNVVHHTKSTKPLRDPYAVNNFVEFRECSFVASLWESGFSASNHSTIPTSVQSYCRKNFLQCSRLGRDRGNTFQYWKSSKS